MPWHAGPVTNQERFGGNLKGIEEKLPYLKELGITGIYLNPIMEADSTHKYDTKDYTRIDPQFGTNEDFARLVKKAHEHGIRIMVDAVFNHCGPPFLSLAGRAGKEGKIRLRRLVYDSGLGTIWKKERTPETPGSIPSLLRTGCPS